jgi:hypothetical protein
MRQETVRRGGVHGEAVDVRRGARRGGVVERERNARLVVHFQVARDHVFAARRVRAFRVWTRVRLLARVCAQVSI